MRKILVVLLLISSWACGQKEMDLSLQSPDGTLVVNVKNEEGKAYYH